MRTNTHAIAWSGEKGQQGHHNYPRPKLAMTMFPYFSNMAST
jgi:hypothetical protein